VIIELAPDARLVAAGLVRRGGGSGSNKPGSRPPLNDGATDAVDEVENMLTTLARDIAEMRGLQIASAASERRLVRDPLIAAATFLSGQIEWMRHAIDGAEPYAIRAFDEIAQCAGRLRGLVNGPGEQKFLGPCGATLCSLCGVVEATHVCEGDIPVWVCDGDVLTYRGAKVGRCKTCGAEVATSEREAWLDGEVREFAFRAAHIAEAYRVNVNTIRSWAARGQLKSYWRTELGLTVEWVDPVLDDKLKGEELEERLGEISDEIQARGGRLHYDAARREGERAKRARRAAVKAAESDGRMTA